MNNLIYHHSYYNYTDNVYPAEEINPLTGEVVPFPDNRTPEIENFVNQVNQQQQQQLNSRLVQVSQPQQIQQNYVPQVAVNPSRKRFFHYRGKILQVVAETDEVQQQPPTSSTAISLYPSNQVVQSTSHSSQQSMQQALQQVSQVFSPGSLQRKVPYKARGPRQDRAGSVGSGSSNPRINPIRPEDVRKAHAAYERARRASLPQEKRDALNAADRERRKRNKERYKMIRQQRLVMNPELAAQKRKQRTELQKKYYQKLTPEQKREKYLELKKKKEERIAQMSPEEREKYLAEETEKKRQKLEKIRQREKEKMAKMSEEELRQYLDKKNSYKQKYKKRNSTDPDDPDQPSTSKKRGPRGPRGPRKPQIKNLSGAVLNIMLFEFKLGHNSYETYQNLVKVFGAEEINLATVSHYFENFQKGEQPEIEVVSKEEPKKDTKKRGRKPKNQDHEDEDANEQPKEPKKRGLRSKTKATEDQEDDEEPKEKKKRGPKPKTKPNDPEKEKPSLKIVLKRPAKKETPSSKKPAQRIYLEEDSESDFSDDSIESVEYVEPVKKKTRKSNESNKSDSTPKKRGRPKKNQEASEAIGINVAEKSFEENSENSKANQEADRIIEVDVNQGPEIDVISAALGTAENSKELDTSEY